MVHLLQINLVTKEENSGGWYTHSEHQKYIPSHFALQWNPQARRFGRRPRTTWRRTVLDETGKTILQLGQIAQGQTQ